MYTLQMIVITFPLLFRWTSCIKLLYEINDLPVLIVNTNDDPLVVLANTRILDIPKSYVGE